MRKGSETGPVPPPSLTCTVGPPAAFTAAGGDPPTPRQNSSGGLSPSFFKIPHPISDNGFKHFTHCKDKGTGSDEKEVTDDEEGDHTGAHHEPVLSHPHAQGTGAAHPEAHPSAPVTPVGLCGIVYRFPRICCNTCTEDILLF